MRRNGGTEQHGRSDEPKAPEPVTDPGTIEQQLAVALQFVGSGRIDQAEELFHAVLLRRPAHAGALHGLGLVAYMRRRYAEAIERFRQAIQIDATNPQYHSNLGEALRRSGHPKEALAAFHRSQILMPEFLKAHLGMGNCLRDLGRFEEAIARFRLALAINPNFAEAYHYLGVTLLERDKAAAAISLLRKAVALRPEYVEAQISLANALERQGPSEEALEIYLRILERDPNNTAAHNNAGNILRSLGRIDEAVSHYRQALAVDPDHASAYYNLSHAGKGAGGEELVRMEAMLEDPKLPVERRTNLHFALGKIYDDLGEYEKAFAHSRKGNELDTRGVPFNATAHSAFVERLMAVFSGEFFAARKGFGSESDVPVLVLGMPRSGTTLVEQCLASHPEVYGAGELDLIGRIITSQPQFRGEAGGYPESAVLIDAATACELGEAYVSQLRVLGRESRRVVDKMPGNFLNLGFIALTLPNARIVHCRRHPLDVCLSCYFQHFTSVMPFSRDFASLGHYYRDYVRLMAHWHRILPTKILDVRYEEMVGDQEGVSRRIVEFCGLEWDDACLDFHKTVRPVKTASSWQVRQPVYTTSVDRWRNYEKFIGELEESLGDLIEDYRSK